MIVIPISITVVSQGPSVLMTGPPSSITAQSPQLSGHDLGTWQEAHTYDSLQCSTAT